MYTVASLRQRFVLSQHRLEFVVKLACLGLCRVPRIDLECLNDRVSLACLERYALPAREVGQWAEQAVRQILCERKYVLKLPRRRCKGGPTRVLDTTRDHPDR